MLATLALIGRYGWLLSTHWTNNLIKMSNFRFSESSCLKGVRLRSIKEYIRHSPLASACIDTGTHSCA